MKRLEAKLSRKQDRDDERSGDVGQQPSAQPRGRLEIICLGALFFQSRIVLAWADKLTTKILLQLSILPRRTLSASCRPGQYSFGATTATYTLVHSDDQLCVTKSEDRFLSDVQMGGPKLLSTKDNSHRLAQARLSTNNRFSSVKLLGKI